MIRNTFIQDIMKKENIAIEKDIKNTEITIVTEDKVLIIGDNGVVFKIQLSVEGTITDV